MQTPGIGGSSAPQSASADEVLRDLDMSAFLNLMIAELQNQDPLDPMDNAQMLEQISQIRSIESTGRLTDTLDSVLLGQNIASASGLIGKQVRALGADGAYVTGEVDRVTIAGGEAKVHIGEKEFTLDNVAEIRDPSEAA